MERNYSVLHPTVSVRYSMLNQANALMSLPLTKAPKLIMRHGTKIALMLQHAAPTNLSVYTMFETLKHPSSKTTNLNPVWYAANFQMIRSTFTVRPIMANLTLLISHQRSKSLITKLLDKLRHLIRAPCNVLSRWEDIKTGILWWSVVKTAKLVRCISILLLSLSHCFWRHVVLSPDIMMRSDVLNITSREIWWFHLVLITHWEFGILRLPGVWLFSVATAALFRRVDSSMRTRWSPPPGTKQSAFGITQKRLNRTDQHLLFRIARSDSNSAVI